MIETSMSNLLGYSLAATSISLYKEHSFFVWWHLIKVIGQCLAHCELIENIIIIIFWVSQYIWLLLALRIYLIFMPMAKCVLCSFNSFHRSIVIYIIMMFMIIGWCAKNRSSSSNWQSKKKLTKKKQIFANIPHKSKRLMRRFILFLSSFRLRYNRWKNSLRQQYIYW